MLIGIAALLAPRRVAVRFTAPGPSADGGAALAWRLFAARQVCLGAGGLAGVRAARDVNLVLQPIDLVVFAHASRTGEMPPGMARLGVFAATVAFADTLCAIALRRRR